jgi:hypothetical protein
MITWTASTLIPALPIATLLNSAKLCSNNTLGPARIARPMSSRARMLLEPGTVAVA